MRTKFRTVSAMGLLLALCSLSSANVYAAISSVTTKVSRVLHVDDEQYGGCMARLESAASGVSCSTWVSFSCTGDFTSKSNAYRMFDLAQMALALDKSVRVYVNDAKKHNGYCMVERVDVNK